MIIFNQTMSTLLMTTIRLILISVLLNAAFVKAEHQLTHFTQAHTLEQCDVCSHPSHIDDAITPTFYTFLQFIDNNQALLSSFSVAKQTSVKTLYARAPPTIA